jgi:hypothetical protein
MEEVVHAGLAVQIQGHGHGRFLAAPSPTRLALENSAANPIISKAVRYVASLCTTALVSRILRTRTLQQDWFWEQSRRSGEIAGYAFQ